MAFRGNDRISPNTTRETRMSTNPPRKHSACHAPMDGTACRKWCGDKSCLTPLTEVERLRALVSSHEAEIQLLRNALWKACGDDEDVVNATIESQRGGS